MQLSSMPGQLQIDAAWVGLLMVSGRLLKQLA
jgi:hypothetical protein